MKTSLEKVDMLLLVPSQNSYYCLYVKLVIIKQVGLGNHHFFVNINFLEYYA